MVKRKRAARPSRLARPGRNDSPLARLREKRGLSQPEAASKLGITRFYLSRLERGVAPLRRDLNLAEAMAELYGSTPGRIAALQEHERRVYLRFLGVA